MNSGPYVDHDEYRDGPIAPKCRFCDLPFALCDCPPSWHAEPGDNAIIGWWPVAIFAVFALAIAIVAVRVF